jgi:GntR family transcriptional regulator
MALLKQSPIPLYYQLAELLREQIRQGELAPGAQVPAERILAAHYGISRMTARQAIAYLVREGVVMARHGLGTFVAEPKLTHDALHLLGFTEEIMRQGGTVISQVIEQHRQAAPPAVAEALALDAGAEVIKVVRLRLTHELPLLLETSYLTAALCPGLDRVDLASQSLYSVLELRYGLRLRRARQVLEATTANDFEAEQFGITTEMAMFLLEGVAFDELDRPIEYSKAIYRGDRFKFSFTSERGSGAADPEGAQISVVFA